MRKYSKHLRLGLQLRAILILTGVVLAVMALGGWSYFTNAQRSQRLNDKTNAMRLAEALAVAAQYELRDGQTADLQRLATDFLRGESVRFVSIVGADGEVVASASRDGETWAAMRSLPPAVSDTQQLGPDTLTVARPVVIPDAGSGEGRIVGAIRLAFDTSATSANLDAVQLRMTRTAGALVLGAIPLGYLLLSRLLVQPFRRLVEVTRRLAKGDFSARARFNRNDEMGELAGAFDAMAGEVAQMRARLIQANEGLERKVADRTEQIRQANVRLRQEMAEKEDFLRAVSHDLNAPLRNIAGLATLMLMKWRDALPEEVVARLQRIQANVDVETELLTELLELSRIRSRPQKRKAVDMARMLADVAATFEYELQDRNIQLTIAPGMPILWVEEARMRQVFQNLIDNAIKYMDRIEGGRIDIAWRLADGMHEFSVADNGPGIAPEHQDTVFQVFRRIETPATAKVQGKGVGLALVRTVASNYEGRAWVESKLGEGATFRISLKADDVELPENHAAHEHCESK